MPSKWIEFIKQWAKDHNTTYGCAMSQPECKNAYHKKYDTPKYQKERREKETEQMVVEDSASRENTKPTQPTKPKQKEGDYMPYDPHKLYKDSYIKENAIPNIPLSNPIWKYSNPKKVKKNADKYLGKDFKIFVNPNYDSKIGNNKGKKYWLLVKSPSGRPKEIYFGQYGMEDFTKHEDPVRRASYLARATNIRGKWKEDKFSPNNLAIHLLWS